MMRMALISQRVFEAESAIRDGQLDKWSTVTGGSVESKVKASFKSMLELLQCEELFPSEPSLSQRSDEQARQVMIAQIAASKLLFVISLNNGCGCKARKEFVAQVKLMLVSDEACVFAANVMIPLVATQIGRRPIGWSTSNNPWKPNISQR